MNPQIIILTTKIFNKNQLSFLEYILTGKDVMVKLSPYMSNQINKNWSKNPFTDDVSISAETVFETELPRLNVKCYYISQADIQQHKNDIMFMKYNPKCMYIITDEYNNLPFYLETNNYIIKTNNILRYLSSMKNEVLQ